ncbi:unnamed protein product [Mytilus coruscus]|uniref:Uncharacterized protein n=1 Tax=Mytilus coruscus TaxID=42192 RepID=A0A6J8D7K4_MYTCO|nr:unnamed protein product [Mytilus coruscus]
MADDERFEDSDLMHALVKRQSDQVYEASHDFSNIETEEEEETIILRPRSKLSKRPSPRKPGSPRRSSRYRRQNDLENKSEPQNQGDTGVYDIIKVAIQDMTGQVVSAIQNAFTGITKQYRHTNASSEQQKHARSIPNANNNITSASECDETDDEVISDACSDINTNSIDTDVISQTEVVEHEPKMLLECEDTLEVNNQNAMRRLKFHDSNLMSGKGVSKEEIIRHLTNKEKAETRNVPVHLQEMLKNIAPGHSETEKDAIADILNK